MSNDKYQIRKNLDIYLEASPLDIGHLGFGILLGIRN